MGLSQILLSFFFPFAWLLGSSHKEIDFGFVKGRLGRRKSRMNDKIKNYKEVDSVQNLLQMWLGSYTSDSLTG